MANVLCIDPDTTLAGIYVRAFEHAGHRAVHVASAQAALDAADEFMPDVVVLELQLVGHDGIEFLHEFRSYQEWEAVPVIINTHMPPERLLPVRAALERDFGVRAWFYKPDTTLARLVNAVISQIGRTV